MKLLREYSFSRFSQSQSQLLAIATPSPNIHILSPLCTMSIYWSCCYCDLIQSEMGDICRGIACEHERCARCQLLDTEMNGYYETFVKETGRERRAAGGANDQLMIPHWWLKDVCSYGDITRWNWESGFWILGSGKLVIRCEKRD